MSTLKLSRNYEVVFAGDQFGDPLTIGLPFTIEFDITRNTLTSANVCQIRLYNLNEDHRKKLLRNITNTGEPYVSVLLKAGYGPKENLGIIFSGNISQCWSVREGVSFVTQVECFDGGFAFVNAKVPPNLSNVPKNTSNQSVIKNMISSLPNVSLGSVGDFQGKTAKAKVYTGNTIDVLKTLTGGAFYIDKGVGNALKTGEYIATGTANLIINASSGLLNTPVLEQSIVRFDMIFEPELQVGTLVTLESITESTFNGSYLVTAVKHRGTISQTICGEAITTGEFFFIKTPVGVQSATG